MILSTPTVGEMLAAVEAEMQAVLEAAPQEENGFGTMLRYPLGWVTADGEAYTSQTGKRIRPILLLLCAQAAGDNWEKALPAAAAVELLHNFSLVHDDIEDNSPIRHGRETVWKIWGMPNAINVGDALFTLSMMAVHRLAYTALTPEIALHAVGLFSKTALTLTRGQHLDMRFEQCETVTTNEYIDMVGGKTAALLGLCAELGALVTSGNIERAANFGEFGVDVGIAFQIHDDILGIWGDESQTGKSAALDILTRKKSLPVLYGLEHSARMREIYAQPTAVEIDVREVIGLLNEVGALEYAKDLEQQYNQKSAEALKRANPEAVTAGHINNLLDMLFNRQH